jgi:lipopolysaccharide biosynthesis glycosyltransferase
MSAIHIATFFDQGFSLQAAIFAASLAKTATQERPVKLHAFCVGDFCERFADLVMPLASPCFFVVCKPIDNPFDRSDIPAAYFNHVYCMRLLLGQLLSDCDRVLYLDTDIFVRRSLAELYDADLGDKIIAAVPDNYGNSDGITPCSSVGVIGLSEYRKHLSIIKNPYLNSGVLLIDLQKWRGAEVQARCLEVLRERPTILFSDQDALNVVLGDRALLVGYEWNCRADQTSCANGPAIVHFIGELKPWLPQGPSSDFHAEYWAHALSTPYGEALVDKFYLRAMNEAACFQASFASRVATIPPRFRHFETGWARYLPSPLLRAIAEACCTFGNGRIHRAGVAMFNILKGRTQAVEASR